MNFIRRLPRWSATIVTFMAILWLTLAPHPVPQTDILLFPGADKVIHAIMFGGLAGALYFDLWRKGVRPISWKSLCAGAVASSIAGGIIEILQYSMGLGRSFEWTDILADTAGAAVCALAVGYVQFKKI